MVHKSLFNIEIEQELQKKYADMLNLDHPVSRKYPPMLIENRAAQFAPFAALAGHEDAIKETARLMEARIEHEYE